MDRSNKIQPVHQIDANCFRLNKSNEILKQVNDKISKDKTIIGVGGIDSWESANEKFNNGADLIQLYTGLVYKGPSVIRDILKY